MARVAVCSAVYLGDVAPFLAVARRLAERGHDVVAVLPEGFRALVASEPFGFRPYALDCSPSSMHADPAHARLMRAPVRNAIGLGRYWMARAFTDDPDAAIASLQAGFDGADVVLSHPTFALAAQPVAHSMGIPIVVGHLFPMMLPTRQWAPPMGPTNPRLGVPLNRAAWFMFEHAVGPVFRDRQINRARRGLGCPPLRNAAGLSYRHADRVVLLASRHYFGDAPADWPPMTWTGFVHWEGPPDQELDSAVDSFLGDGPPSVLVTLGTSAATGAEATFRRIRDGLAAAGLRSLLLTGPTVDIGALAQQPGVFPFAPLHLVLPRCTAAVVSGALGSYAAAMQAGLPTVVAPQLFDQVWNGRRLEQLGTGALARRPEKVAPAMQCLLADDQVRSRAEALAARMAGEDGANTCADAVEEVLADTAR